MSQSYRGLIPPLAVLVGGLIILGSLGLMAGGATVTWIRSSFMDPDGYLTTDWEALQSDAYAIVQSEADTRVEVDVPRHIWRQRAPATSSIRLTVRGGDPGDEVFIGVASELDALAYLDGVAYDEIPDICWSCDPRGASPPEITYEAHEGSAPGKSPLEQGSWEASASGSGTQTLQWTPEDNGYMIVVMNADGSQGVDVEVQLSAKVPGLAGLGNLLLASGTLGVLVGGLVIYLGAIRYRDHTIGGVVSQGDLLKATWGERLFAYLIDLVVLSVLVSWMSWPGCEWIPHSMGSWIPRWAPYSDFGFRNVIYFLYWALLEGIYSQSVGKRLIGIKLTRLDGSPAGLGKAAIQSIGKAFLLPVDLVLGWMFPEAGRQRLFNRLSGTVVVGNQTKVDH